MAHPKLNAAQKEAVAYADGPLLIVAGAGTGKTTVITQKILHLIENGFAKPEEILALTFTEKAAEEMKTRVDDLLDIGYVDLSISTFHAFCQRLLEQFGLAIGIPNQWKLLTDTDAWLLVKQHIYDFRLDYYRPLGNPARHIHALLRHFSKCKDELIDPAAYMAYAEGRALDGDAIQKEERSRLTEIAESYHQYNQLLLQAGALDFGDLIFYSVRLFTERKRILQQLQERYRYVLVDEFQDVNYAQYELIRLITSSVSSARPPQLTVVGDDDQSIYAFRGASVSNILRFKDDFPEAKDVVLTQNYRSPQAILDLAYASIQHNNPDRLEQKLQINKQLVAAAKKQPVAIEHLHGQTLDDEVHLVVNHICSLKETHSDVAWDDIAILVRANNHADPFIRALEVAGIPYEFLSSSGLFRQDIVLNCFNFLKIIDQYHESTAMYRLLRLPFLQFKESDMQKITEAARKKSISYYEAAKRALEFHLSAEGARVCSSLIDWIHAGMKRTRYEKPTVVLYEFLEESGYLSHLTHGELAASRHIIRDIHFLKQFFDFIRAYEEITPDASLSSFLDYFSSLLESGDDGKLFQLEDTPDSVNIMTVHAAKGLEFRFVFLVNVVEERFPTRPRGDSIEIPQELVKERLPEGDYHMQEERRLFYVGITRAKEGLYISSADDYGGVRKKKLSRFLAELGWDIKIQKEKESKSTNALASTARHKKKQEQPSERTAFVYEPPKSFSFSQIRSYQKCPYQYKLAYILKIPIKGNAHFSFGSTIHNTLQKFYARIQELNGLKQDSLFGLPEAPSISSNISVPPLGELLKLYETCWIDDWYQSKRQREAYKQKGKDILEAFYASEENQWTIPAALESWFQIKIGPYAVNGRMDRVDRLPDGTLEIIDYKTGAPKERLAGEDKEQLLLYQIAAERLPEYSHMGRLAKLTFYYVENTSKASFVGSSKELRGLEETLVKTADAIHGGNFQAVPNAHICAHCDFRDICDFRV